MINIGVIGAGRMGRIHVENIQKRIPNARVCAIAKRHFLDETRAWAADLSIDKLYTDFMDLIKDREVDAILVTSPVGTHKKIALAAIREHKHVLCEKPLDVSADNIIEIIRELKDSNIKFQVGFNRRFDPAYARVKEAAETGELGRVFMVKMTSKDMNPPSYEYVASSGGQIIDSAIHEIDLARFLTGDEVDEVYAAGNALIDPNVAKYGDTDVLVITMKMTRGAYVVVDIARKSPAGADRRVEVFGEKSIVIVNNNKSDLLTTLNMAGAVTAPPTDGLTRFAQSWLNETRTFVNCIEENLESPVGAYDGLQAILIATAANRSLKEKRVVKITEIN